jgi:hypothetical protein
MNTERPVEDRIQSWLLETAPAELPDRVFDATFERTRSMSQASGVRPWRTPAMNPLARMAAAVIAVVLVVGTGAYLLGEGPQNGGTPTSSPSTSASPVPTSSVRFISPEYQYSLQMPPTWAVSPATAPWPGTFQLGEDPRYADSFVLQGSPEGASVSIKAHLLSTGTNATAWLSGWEHAFEVGGHCFGSATPWTDSSAAGIPARRLEWRCDSAQDAKSNYDMYSFVSGRTGYVISGTPSMVQVAVQSFRAP